MKLTNPSISPSPKKEYFVERGPPHDLPAITLNMHSHDVFVLKVKSHISLKLLPCIIWCSLLLSFPYTTNLVSTIFYLQNLLLLFFFNPYLLFIFLCWITLEMVHIQKFKKNIYPFNSSAYIYYQIQSLHLLNKMNRKWTVITNDIFLYN